MKDFSFNTISNQPTAKAFFLALSLLTRLPIPELENIDAQDSGRSALFYPLIGLIIGMILYLPVFLFPQASPLLLAAIVTVMWAMITGGLHLDGIADSADGWLGGADDKEKTLKIMKDPVVGAAGAIAIMCILLLKFAVLSALFQQASSLDNIYIGAIIILAPFIGRVMILLLMLVSENANPNSMANDVVNHLARNKVAWVIGISFLILAFFSFLGLAFALVVFGFTRRLMHKRLGGYTGDTLGATVEITEVMYLIAYALHLS